MRGCVRGDENYPRFPRRRTKQARARPDEPRREKEARANASEERTAESCQSGFVGFTYIHYLMATLSNREDVLDWSRLKTLIPRLTILPLIPSSLCDIVMTASLAPSAPTPNASTFDARAPAFQPLSGGPSASSHGQQGAI